MLRRTLIQLSRRSNVVLSRGAGSSTVERLNLPPSPVFINPEYIEPRWVAEEHAQASYRSFNKSSKLSHRLGTIFGMILWTWVLLGLWYESEHVTGHWPWPDSSKWTDKELGIPDELDLE